MSEPRKRTGQSRQAWVIGCGVAVGVVSACVAMYLAAGRPVHKLVATPAQNAHTARLVRVSADQYRQIIADVFGSTISLEGKLSESEARVNGLLAVGAAQESYSSAGFASAQEFALAIAGQVTDRTHRDTLIACRPHADGQPDDGCARTFFARTGRLLYRRALTDQELATLTDRARAATTKLGDFYTGLAESLTGMLVAPDFLFRVESADLDLNHPGLFNLTAYSKASRLAALLWNSNPDDELLTAAESGQLDNPEGLHAQIDRMLASAKLQNGTRAYFSDMLEFDKFAALDKDSAIYPRYSAVVGADMREQALRVLVDELLVKKSDYRKLFQTRELFLDPQLAALMDIPMAQQRSNGEPGTEWVKYEFPPGDQRAGFLVLPAFTALNSHPGKSSPTLRGKAIREDLLCEKIPDPPAGVNFELFNSGKTGATARDRLVAHATVPACAGCHKLMDPLGLGMERFDGVGHVRDTEDGHALDTRGELDGVPFSDSQGLGAAVGNSSAATACLVKRVFAYGVARSITYSDRKFIKGLTHTFEEQGRTFPGLLRALTSAPEFYQQREAKQGPALQTLTTQVAKGDGQ